LEEDLVFLVSGTGSASQSEEKAATLFFFTDSGSCPSSAMVEINHTLMPYYLPHCRLV
jgi:hypothetical protein